MHHSSDHPCALPSTPSSEHAASSLPPSPATPDHAARVRQWLMDLQTRIIQSVEHMEAEQATHSSSTPAGRFVRDAWHKNPGDALQGDGITQILEGGAVFERAGIGFSHVRGTNLPPSATKHRPDLAGAPFEAMGVSLVFHPRNPYVPTVHMNVRMIAAGTGQDAACWFGGGMDLTPYYGFEQDCQHFHRTCRDALAPFGADKYPRFKQWCDEYFVNHHRGEQRGIGGIFYDDFSEGGFDNGFALMQATGDAFWPAYGPIAQRCQPMAWGERERDHQLYRRGRYVEFNLVWDRGTHFGLQSGGRTESILLSMPPLVRWQYQHQPEAGSPEAELLTHYLQPRDWVPDPDPDSGAGEQPAV